MSTASLPCHVYVVAPAEVIFDHLMSVGNEPCHVCGQWLGSHEWRTSGLLDAGRMYVIDEKALMTEKEIV